VEELLQYDMALIRTLHANQSTRVAIDFKRMEQPLGYERSSVRKKLAYI
jgi:hypothetical protein